MLTVDNLRLVVGFPTLIGGYVADHCVEHLLRQQGVDLQILVIDNGGRVSDGTRKTPRVTVVDAGSNWGVARSWNHIGRWAFGGGHPQVLILNDDLNVQDPTFCRRIAEKGLETPRSLPFHARFGFACFLWTRTTYEVVGPFDEGFWPAYMEDSDYGRRLTLAGVPEVTVDGAANHDFGATSKLVPGAHDWISRCWERNRLYFRAKWGDEDRDRPRDLIRKPWGGQ